MTSRMIGKRAKILGPAHVEDLLFFAQHTRHPLRNRVIVLLSVKDGLRAAEIANLAWAMVVDPTGEIAATLELQDRVAKKGSAVNGAAWFSWRASAESDGNGAGVSMR